MPPSHHPTSPPLTLVALLGMRARLSPAKNAYQFLADGEHETARLTYGELDARARAIAARLQGVIPTGSRALLLYPPGLEFLSAFFGCLYAGVIAVPSYPPKRNRSDPRLQAIAADAGAELALTDGDVLGDLEARLTHIPALRALQWLATDSIATDEAKVWRDPGVSSEHLAFLQYTSGSTSTPKGVMVSHRNLLHNLDDLDRGWDHTPESVMVTWLPIFHDMGLIYGALMPLFRGFTCVMLPPSTFLQRPVRWLEAIAHYRGTHSAAPNFAYDLCVASTRPDQRAVLDLSSWRFSLNAAEPVRAQTLAAFNAAFGPCGLSPLTVSPGYGLAEATLKVSALPRAEPTHFVHVRSEALVRHEVVICAPDEAGAQTLVGCGWGQADNRYVIVEPESQVRCPEGRVGEIWFSGPSVAQGYWGRSLETAETFGARLASGEGPFLRTGDLGFIHARELYITGRLKDLIILRGLNHYPHDIELTVEMAHPALRPACGAAFSVDLHGAESLVVVQEVERTYLRRLQVDEVIAAIRQAVAEQHYLSVSAVLLLRTGSIPKTSSGKIMRRACRQAYLQRELESVGEWQQPGPPAPTPDAVAALPVLESAVIETWLTVRLAQRLHLDPRQIDPSEPFSRYGLDSVAAVELSGALEDWLGRRLSPTLVYDYPSVRTLAAHLAAQAVAALGAGSASGAIDGGCTSHSAVAIIGLGCRFPGGESPGAFWEILREGRDAITGVPAGRWDPALVDAPAQGGFLENIDAFDSDFFGIAPREADLMDPQQRILLEVAYEALEDAGIVPKSLAGSRAGVFVGISTGDYGRLLARVAAGTEAYAGTGNALSIAANRISYLLDLRGPSLVVDTACSSSLVAVHQAMRSLRAGDSTLALVGGVNLILTTELSTTFARAGMLASDGRCKTFDAAADGYVRGEGCGVVILKLLADAQRDGDRVLAVIRGTAVNQDGRSNGLTAPNGPAQQAVVRAALRDAGLAPADIGYVEAHGTGTNLGDPIEVNALRDVLLENRTLSQPCLLGSVKTNIGHLEAAAGIAGLIKVVLALQHREIPPHLNLRTINPLIDLAGTPLAIATQRTAWEGTRRYAGISSFGFGGTNAHVIVGEAESGEVTGTVRPQHALVLSARSAGALRGLAGKYAALLESVSQATVGDIAHAAAVQRAALPHRLTVPADVSVAATLAAFARDGAAPDLWSGEVAAPPRVAFMFSGQGSLYPGVGRELAASQPVFRAALDECQAIVQARAGWDVVAALDSAAQLACTEFAQVALFALEYALARTWQAWGVEPTVVIGHSVGEYAAAVVAGALRLEDGLALLIMRAKLMGALPEDGAMLAVSADAATVAPSIARHGVEIGAFNSPRQTVLTGPRAAVTAAAEDLKRSGLRMQDLGVSQGYHSRLMEPMLADFAAVAADARLGVPKKQFLSSVTGRVATDELACADYWTKQIRQPVRFADAVQSLAATGTTLLLEVGPRGILAALGQQSWSGAADWLVSLQPGRDEWAQMLEAAGRAFVRGVPVRWHDVDRGFAFPRVTLPTYPFQRRRHWFAKTFAGDDTTELEALLEKVDLAPEDRAAAPRVLAALRRARENAGAAEALRDCLYEIHWPAQVRGAAPNPAVGRWLLLGAADFAFTTALRARGQGFEIATDIRPGAWRGVIFIAGDDPGEDECARLLQVAQAAGGAPLWIVTRGAVAVTADEARTLRLNHAPLWGFGKAFALEHAERWGGMIDLPLQATADDFAALADELLAPSSGDDQVALRGNARHVARLERVPLPAAAAPALRAEGVYWITGGTGALGLHVARWLIAKGARKLVLTARREPGAETERAIAALRTPAVNVRVLAADSADADDVARVLRTAAAELGPVRGIVHAAGLLGQEALATLTPTALADVLRPKVAGARVLHAATRELELDLFILFSSIASIWGSKAQAHYAAANQALDALAQHRRALGLPALSLNWGPWAGGGMAGEEEQALLARFGITTMAPAAALGALDRLLTGDRPQVAVARVNGRVFKDLFELRGPKPFLSVLGAPTAKTATPSGRSAEIEAIAAAPSAQRRERLQAFLQAQVAAVLGMKAGDQPDPKRGFFEMGIDSLMAVDLRNRLVQAFGRSFPSTLAFDYANIRLLAAHLAEDVLDDAAVEMASAPAVVPVAELPPVDENDLDAALAARLARLESLVKNT